MTEQLKPPKYNKESVFKTPNTVLDYYGKDVPGAFELYGPGKDRFSLHLSQYTDYTNIPVKYEFNSLGLRGPEPDYNNNTRLLFAGSSQTFGVGLPVEYTYPYLVAQKMNASYINLSDIDVFTDILEYIKEVKDFNPTHIILSDTRFVQRYGFMFHELSRRHLTKIYEDNSEFAEIFKECDKRVVSMMELCLKQMFPNSQLYYGGTNRRLFKHSIPEFQYMQTVMLTKEDAVDLARDNTHLGIRTNQRYAAKLYSAFTAQWQESGDSL
jgi:hypothetical protein